VSYRVLILEDETTQVASRGPTGDTDYCFTRHIAFDLGDDDRGAEVARIIAESHRKRVANSTGEAPVCPSAASDGAATGVRT
jgi:hypothetical protein